MIIAVASGKGGTGKTLVATSLALSAERCVYIDLDVEEPNGHLFIKPNIETTVSYRKPVPEIDETRCTFCAKCSRACQYHALTIIPALKKTMFFPELCHFCGACTYVCPVQDAIREVPKEIGQIRLGTFPSGRFIEGRLNVGQPSGVPLIAGVYQQLAGNQDLVIADLPPGTSCPVVEGLKKSDYVLLVTEPTPFGRNDLELSLEIVRDLKKPAALIINKDNGNSKSIESLGRKANIPVLKKIPYSIAIQQAYSRGTPYTERFPEEKREFSKILREIDTHGRN